MRKGEEFKRQLDIILRFDKEIYRKSGNRYVTYVIWFAQFLFGCFMAFMGDLEAYLVVGFVNYLNVLLVSSGAVVVVGENGRMMRLEVCRLYNIDINVYILSKCILMAKASAITAIILAILAVIEWSATDWGRILGCLFWIFATYLANVLIVVINEKIRDNAKIR